MAFDGGQVPVLFPELGRVAFYDSEHEFTRPGFLVIHLWVVRVLDWEGEAEHSQEDKQQKLLCEKRRIGDYLPRWNTVIVLSY